MGETMKGSHEERKSFVISIEAKDLPSLGLMETSRGRSFSTLNQEKKSDKASWLRFSRGVKTMLALLLELRLGP